MSCDYNATVRSFVLLFPLLLPAAEKPFLESEFIFPLETWHNHASCIVELSNDDLLVCWFHGSGERTADDVKIEGARRVHGSKSWSPRYTLADTPGFPDTNPAMLIDRDRKLWLFWPVIMANEWHTALMKYRISTDYLRPAPPAWSVSDNLLFVPRNFSETVKRVIEPQMTSGDQSERAVTWRKRVLEKSADKYFSRMGWMTRAHPVQLPSGRILVPLYSDGYSFSLIAMTDDGGATWTTSEPLVGAGNIQPTIVRKRDGTLVAYMRDNGPPPKRVATSTSRDDGVTWSPVVDSEIPNPGTGLEAIVMRDGTWAMIYNDLERGRHSLAVSLSDDEGATWKWTRHLDRDLRGEGAGSFHYPSIVQAHDGTLHVSYSYFLNHLTKGSPAKTIKHAHFNVAWVKGGSEIRIAFDAQIAQASPRAEKKSCSSWNKGGR
jgi:predicted neuraminidase